MDAGKKKLLLWGALAFLALSGAGGLAYIFMSRSLKAKNPGSIDDIGQTYGLPPEEFVKPNPDSRLITFSRDFGGAHALVVQLYDTIFKHGNDTLPSLVHTWAPSSDGNNEAEYVDFLSKRTGLNPWDRITIPVFKIYVTSLAKAIGRMEMGVEMDAPHMDPGQVADGMMAGMKHVGLA